jgi:hypothetical protein
MRVVHAALAVAALAAGADMLDASPAVAACSVFDRHPCHPTFCGVFHRGPCIPEIQYPIGQDLRLTIDSGSAGENAVAATAGSNSTDASPDRKLDTLTAMFDALRHCWVPPPREEARPGMQMSVRFSFKRSGEIIGTPRVTYASPDAPREVREHYRNAITAALERCTPLPLSQGLGGAVAGRPIAIRFVDNRDKP